MPERIIHELRQQLNAHVDDFNKFKTEQELRNKHEDERWHALLKAQERNAQGIEDLTTTTREVVEAYTIANNTVKGLGVFGRVVRWAAGFAVVGTAINWFLNIKG